MNKQMKRLYEAAEKVLGISGRGSQAAIGRLIGSSSQKIKNWELREAISKDGLIKLSKALHISIDWLEYGRGPMMAPGAILDAPVASRRSKNKLQSGASEPIAMGTRRIPLISYVQAGHWMDAINCFLPDDVQEWLLTDLDLPDSCFGLQIKGDSMLPEFKEGDRIIVDPTVEPRPGDFVVAQNGKEEATFKKYRPRGNNAKGRFVFELIPLNEDYSICRSDQMPIRIIGVMVEHRKYRKR
jgi:SOS-response transcriptional repressor LexA